MNIQRICLAFFSALLNVLAVFIAFKLFKGTGINVSMVALAIGGFTSFLLIDWLMHKLTSQIRGHQTKPR
jgi:hypothetical protein